ESLDAARTDAYFAGGVGCTPGWSSQRHHKDHHEQEDDDHDRRGYLVIETEREEGGEPQPEYQVSNCPTQAPAPLGCHEPAIFIDRQPPRRPGIGRVKHDPVALDRVGHPDREPEARRRGDEDDQRDDDHAARPETDVAHQHREANQRQGEKAGEEQRDRAQKVILRRPNESGGSQRWLLAGKYREATKARMVAIRYRKDARLSSFVPDRSGRATRAIRRS